MKRLLSSLLLLLSPLLALAAEAEAPVEHANGLVVGVFLVLFLGSIVAYGVYLWWKARGVKPGEE